MGGEIPYKLNEEGRVAGKKVTNCLSKWCLAPFGEMKKGAWHQVMTKIVTGDAAVRR